MIAANLCHHLPEETGTGPAAAGPMTSVSRSPPPPDRTLKNPERKVKFCPISIPTVVIPEIAPKREREGGSEDALGAESN